MPKKIKPSLAKENNKVQCLLYMQVKLLDIWLHIWDGDSLRHKKPLIPAAQILAGTSLFCRQLSHFTPPPYGPASGNDPSLHISCSLESVTNAHQPYPASPLKDCAPGAVCSLPSRNPSLVLHRMGLSKYLPDLHRAQLQSRVCVCDKGYVDVNVRKCFPFQDTDRVQRDWLRVRPLAVCHVSLWIPEHVTC